MVAGERFRQLEAAENDCAVFTMGSPDFAPYLVLRLGAPFGQQIAVDGTRGQARVPRGLAEQRYVLSHGDIVRRGAPGGQLHAGHRALLAWYQRRLS